MSILNFLSKSRNFYKKKNTNKGNLLFLDRERIDNIFQFSFLSLAISKKYKLNTIILSDQKKNSLIINIYKKLGYTNFIKGYSFIKILYKPFILFNSLIYFFYSIIKTYFNGFDWFINKFKINNIKIGDLIYDTNIRYQHRFIKPKIDLYFLKLLLTSIFRFFIIKEYIENYNVKKILIGTETGSRNHGIALRISSKLNIKNYSYSRIGKYGLSLISHKKDYLLRGIETITKKEFLKISKNISIKKINNFYNKRKKLKTSNWYTMNDYKIANLYNKKSDTFINFLSNETKTKILFASHAFADAPHASGQFIFNDYFDQFMKTLNFAYNDDQNLWIFKPHPNSRILDEKKIFKKQFMNNKKNNILLCPDNIPIQKLLDTCDVVITGRGTIGMEFAALGKKAIIAGSAPYSDLNIVFQARSKKEYFNFLKNIEELTKSKDSKQIKKISRQLIYILENCLHHKKITNDELSNDKNYVNCLKIITKKNLALKEMFKSFDIISKNNILKSAVYKKLLEIV